MSKVMLALALFIFCGGGARGAATVLEREVEFTNDGVALAATVIAPTGQGRHPGIVLMPGSGAQSREALHGIAVFLVEHGLVALVYDKRGCGKSGGSWTRESLDDLAGDAAAAIAFLEKQPEVDPAAIGAWGISQSGWVVPRLARLRALRFAIVVTGGAVAPREVELAGYDMKLRHAGFSDADRAGARALVERYLDYLATGNGRTELVAALHDDGAKPWVGALGLDRVLPDEADRTKWAWVPTYDPLPDIRALRPPVLVLLGARDPFLPSESIARWTDALSATGNANDQVNVYPTAGHGIRTNGHDMNGPPVYAPGYLDDQIAWLQTIGVLPKGKASGR